MQVSNSNLNQIYYMSTVIYRKHFKYIVLICCFVFVPYYIVTSLIPVDDISLEDLSSLQNYAYSMLALNIIFEPLAVGAVSSLAFAEVTKRQVSLPYIMDNSLMKWAKLSISALAFLAVIFISMPLIILPLFAAIALGFYGVITALSSKWGLNALIASYQLVKGRFWYVTACVVLNTVLYLIVTMFLGFVLPLSIISNVLLSILTSYFYIVTAMICFSLLPTSEAINEYFK